MIPTEQWKDLPSQQDDILCEKWTNRDASLNRESRSPNQRKHVLRDFQLSFDGAASFAEQPGHPGPGSVFKMPLQGYTQHVGPPEELVPQNWMARLFFCSTELSKEPERLHPIFCSTCLGLNYWPQSEVPCSVYSEV